MEFQDTRMIEPEEEQYFSTSDRILALSDYLAEEIVLENIGEQLEKSNGRLADPINYVSLFREKYENISPDENFYDKDYLFESLDKVTSLVKIGLKEKYGVELGEDLDYANPAEYLKDMETLYEFLYIRQYQNLIDYINAKLRKNKDKFLEHYSVKIQEEEHAKDLFVIQGRKKFKNEDDIIILHFINEIIEDIRRGTTSAYVLFDTIVNLDLFEEYNNRMHELIVNYGNKLVLNNDAETAEKYMSLLDDDVIKEEIKSEIWADYLEECELNEN